MSRERRTVGWSTGAVVSSARARRWGEIAAAIVARIHAAAEREWRERVAQTPPKPEDHAGRNAKPRKSSSDCKDASTND